MPETTRQASDQTARDCDRTSRNRRCAGPILRAQALAILATMGLASVGSANFINVTTDVDEFSNASDLTGCSLREAIQSANEDVAYGGCEKGLGTDIIFVPRPTDGIYTLSRAGSTASNSGGDLWVTESVMIVGVGDPRPTIEQGVVNHRILAAAQGTGVLEIINLHFREGNTTASGGAIATFESSRLKATDILFEANIASAQGGAVAILLDPAAPAVPVVGDFTDVTFTLNETLGSGGALYVQAIAATGQQTEFRCLRCDVHDNFALDAGGGARVRSSLTDKNLTAVFEDSEFTDNEAEQFSGGGISVLDAKLELTNTTMSGNQGTNEGLDSAIDTEDAVVLVTGGTYDDSFLILETDLEVDGAVIQNAAAGAIISRSFFSPIQIRNSTIRDSGVAAPGSLLGNTRGTVLGRSDLIIEDTVFSGNVGGVHCDQCDLTMNRTSIIDGTGNHDGGGIHLFGTAANVATLTNVTVSGNSATGADGGGLYLDSDGQVTLNNVTVADNEADTGGGLFVAAGSQAPDIANSILANNTATTAGPNCSGTLASMGYNLISIGTGCSPNATTGDSVGTSGLPVSAQLTALVTLGGLPTHGLQSNSPAIDSASPLPANGTGGACAAVDAIGVARPVDGGGGATCDKGAREYVAGSEGTIFGDGFESGNLSAWN